MASWNLHFHRLSRQALTWRVSSYTVEWVINTVRTIVQKYTFCCISKINVVGIMKF